jgi:predicted DNA binding CopG/RHH family protein/uncharacterized DUF497 family protein
MPDSGRLDWDKANIAHIARHGVKPEEVEQAYANAPLVVLARIERGGEERVLCAGRTGRRQAVAVRLYAPARADSGGDGAHGKSESEGQAMKAKKIKAVTIDTPEFRSEAEEAAWWDQNQDLIADLLVKYGRRGAVPTKNVSVRLPVTDLERARKLAEKRGIGYQTIIKTLLHEALKRESRIAGSR